MRRWRRRCRAAGIPPAHPPSSSPSPPQNPDSRLLFSIPSSPTPVSPMSFSHGAGGTLALPSPPHNRHMDRSQAVHALRRSLSRSPSSAKLLAGTDSSATDAFGLQASPHPSPSRRFTSTPARSHHQTGSYPLSAPSATATALSAAAASYACHPPSAPPRQTVKLSARPAKPTKATSPPSSRPLSKARVRLSPRSPTSHRVLSDAADSGNSGSSGSSGGSDPIFSSPKVTSSPDQENGTSSPLESTPPKKSTAPSESIYAIGASNSSLMHVLRPPAERFAAPTTGALKRSDATMNLDRPNHCSPVAKRRSLHGIATLGQAQDAYDEDDDEDDLMTVGSGLGASHNFHIHEDNPSGYELIGGAVHDASGDAAQQHNALASPMLPFHCPNRQPSLRRSTLQQRYDDKGSLGRKKGERQLAQMTAEKPALTHNRTRLSLDSFDPPGASRDGPFSMGGALPSASTHLMGDARSHQPHPLSKALTTSSSGNSLDEEYTSIPAARPRAPERQTRVSSFSRSLPVQPSRSIGRHMMQGIDVVIVTPEQSQRQWDAFHSTGFVSKINRHPDEDADGKTGPPSTPCKRAPPPLPPKQFATFPMGSAWSKKTTNNNRNSFAGMSSTPFGTPSDRDLEGQSPVIKIPALFRRRGQQGALESNIGRDLGGFEQPEGRLLFGGATESKSFLDGIDMPPTPTRLVLSPSASNLSEHSAESPSTKRAMAMSLRDFTSSPVGGNGKSPQTSQESLLPLGTSRLSLSQQDPLGDGDGDSAPVTPTAARDFQPLMDAYVTPSGRRASVGDGDLCSKFRKVEVIGVGEFSTVFRVEPFDDAAPGPDMLGSDTIEDHTHIRPPFAVKRIKRQCNGDRSRASISREAWILAALKGSDHVVRFIDSWEHDSHLYIKTEFCENGTLRQFLAQHGQIARLDDFRVFKIVHDLCLGLSDIHAAGYMHLDMKPANILIDFAGVLKIADFGLAQPMQRPPGADVEGDREYMAPETLRGDATPKADIFSLGLIVLEAAANVLLPQNGAMWRMLRSGDLSEVPSLTWAPSIEGEPAEMSTQRRRSIHCETMVLNDIKVEEGRYRFIQVDVKAEEAKLCDPADRMKPGGVPYFMLDRNNRGSLDFMVRSMTAKTPCQRPSANRLLDLEGLRWVAQHRREPAMIYEGYWGPIYPAETHAVMTPNPAIVDTDVEMTGT